MLFLRQPAWLWLKKNDPSKLPPVDAATQAMFDAGHAFEPYVESLFPEGVTLGFSDFDEYRSLPLRTQQAFESGANVICAKSSIDISSADKSQQYNVRC